jgi:hypothetical protein
MLNITYLDSRKLESNLSVTSLKFSAQINLIMEKQGSYFLKISGFIPQNIRKEFAPSFRFIFNQLSPECLVHNTGTYFNPNWKLKIKKITWLISVK